MKKNALIVDISCDRNGGIETSIPTTIEEPIYVVDGITHYVVDHTPSLFWKSATESLSHEFVKYADDLIEGNPSSVLKKAMIVKDGVISDERIIKYQNR